MARTIFLEFDEEIISAIQKLSKAGEDEVVLVVPRGARILKNLTGLKLLRLQAAKFKKVVTIATADEKGKLLATRAGFKVMSAVPSESSGAARKAGGRKMVGDIAIRPVRANRRQAEGKKTPSQPDASEEKELSKLIGPSTITEEIKVPEPVKIPRVSYKYTLIPALIFGAITAGLAFFVLPQAEITVVPRVEPIVNELELLVDSQAELPDIQNLTIPGKQITEELSETVSYKASGVKDVGEKASGFVTLYNFSGSTLILKKTTTRLEANGKTYFFLQDVGNIRPTRRSGEQIDAASLIDPVPIVAAEGGDSFNLPEGTRFEIYNEVFGHQPEILYAVNANPISGGVSKEVAIVSEEDIANARAELSKLFLDKLREKISQKLSPDVILAENAASLEVLEESISKEVGEEAEEFELTQTVRANALVFKESDVKELVLERVLRLLPDNKILADKDKQSLEADFVSLDLQAGAGTLRVRLESEVTYVINVEFLKRGLGGKTATQVKEILLARPEITDVKVRFSPFWVKKVPRFQSKLIFKVAESK